LPENYYITRIRYKLRRVAGGWHPPHGRSLQREEGTRRLIVDSAVPVSILVPEKIAEFLALQEIQHLVFARSTRRVPRHGSNSASRILRAEEKIAE
jgi:hypothetical protein